MQTHPNTRRAERLSRLHASTTSAAHRRMIEHAIAFDALDAALALPVPAAPTYLYALRVLRLWDSSARALYQARVCRVLDASTFARAWSERRAFLDRHRSTLLRGLALGRAA